MVTKKVVNKTTFIQKVEGEFRRSISWNCRKDNFYIQISTINKVGKPQILKTFGNNSFSNAKDVVKVERIVQTTNFSPGIYLLKIDNGKTIERPWPRTRDMA